MNTNDRDSLTEARTVTIEGESWQAHLTPTEYSEWVKYDESHPWLSQHPYERVLSMFLAHYRRGINLNKYAWQGNVEAEI